MYFVDSNLQKICGAPIASNFLVLLMSSVYCEHETVHISMYSCKKHVALLVLTKLLLHRKKNIFNLYNLYCLFLGINYMKHIALPLFMEI